MLAEHQREREKAAAFYQRQEDRNAKRLAQNPDAEVKIRSYTGKATFLDQGDNQPLYRVFRISDRHSDCSASGHHLWLERKSLPVGKPDHPDIQAGLTLAWLPLVTMVVSALYVTDDPMFEKAFLTSAFTVALCCLWPAVINTTVGVTSIDRDLVNVSRVLQLPSLVHVRKIGIPSAIPMIFTGMRLSLATGWMVLIAAEMLAQNPGLGKFIWDEFQNGSSDSLGRIMVAVVTIGLIGFLLDRLMLLLQKRISWDKQAHSPLTAADISQGATHEKPLSGNQPYRHRVCHLKVNRSAPCRMSTYQSTRANLSR